MIGYDLTAILLVLELLSLFAAYGMSFWFDNPKLNIPFTNWNINNKLKDSSRFHKMILPNLSIWFVILILIWIF